MDSIERLTRRFLRASLADTVSGNLAAVQRWVTEVDLQMGTLTALVAAGEARRLDRSERMVVKAAHYDGRNLTGDVQGTGGVYQARVQFQPRRAFNCTCPDKAQRGRQVGPCKHVLALGKHWLSDRLQPALAGVSDRVVGILEHTEL